ncbi:MAG: enoyl-CoA hydratase-related protein [Bacteroidota bacterium]
MYEHLLYTTENGIARLTLNRPEVYNAINQKIGEEILDALKNAARDPEVRVLVFSGNGKAFCSGQDLKDSAATPGRSLADSLHTRYNPIIRAMHNMPKPIIARVNGVAAGAGCSLALACDIAIAAEEAKFIEIFINIGLVPDSGSSWLLPRLVGLSKAFEMCTLGTPVSAKDAANIGLINYAVPADELDAKVDAMAEAYAQAPTAAIGLIKKMLHKSKSGASLDEMLDYEAYCQEIAGRSHDHNEGKTAFLEKRKPAFLGK